MVHYENIEIKIRRLLASELEIEVPKLTDDLRWIDSVTPEDASYLLADIQEAFGGRDIFKSFSTHDDMEHIGTTAKLIAHVTSFLDKDWP